MVPSCTNNKSSICTTWIKWCRPVKTTRAVYVLHGFNGTSCTNDKSCICTTWIQWCRPVQMTRAVYVLHGFSGAVLYKRQELYICCMDSMVPSCKNDKSSICTAWIQWCRPVQTTRAVYVLHEFNGTSCTNDKSCICTTSIKWCRPVQATRAVYVESFRKHTLLQYLI